MNGDARSLDPDGNPAEYAEFYERVAQLQAEERYYAANSYAIARREILLGLIRPYAVRGQGLLDVGCASGYYSVPFAGWGGHATGLDVAPTSVALAAQRADQAGVADRCRFVTGDVRDLPFADAEFDVILATEVLEHIREQRQALGEIGRVLKPGGAAIVTTPGALDDRDFRDRLRLRDVHSVEDHGVAIDRLGASQSLEAEGLAHEPYFHDAFTAEGLADLFPAEMDVVEARSLWHRPPLVYAAGALATRLRGRSEPSSPRESPAVADPSLIALTELPAPDPEARAIIAWSALARRVPVARRTGRGIVVIARKVA